MSKKKTILHIIQNFGRGGAETAVVGVLNNLSEYTNIVVAMDSRNEFGDELKYDRYYCLNLPSYYHFPLAIGKLRKIIKEHNVDIVHSTLYWSMILARLATPAHIPVINSIQASLSNSFEYKKKWICWLDRYTYNRRPCTIIGVSKDTLNDYFSFLNLTKGKNYVLYNYVDTSRFSYQQPSKKSVDKKFRMITVGSFKLQKNQLFLLEALCKLNNKDISLDIFGKGELQPMLEKYINENKLPVKLMGQVNNLQDFLGTYDLFVMPSLYEGFSLAVLEGMLMNVPMLLSDIETFREQCDDTAAYFSLSDINDLVNKIQLLKEDQNLLQHLANKGKERVLQHFTLEHHLTSLRKIYAAALVNKPA